MTVAATVMVTTMVAVPTAVVVPRGNVVMVPTANSVVPPSRYQGHCLAGCTKLHRLAAAAGAAGTAAPCCTRRIQRSCSARRWPSDSTS